MSKLEELRNLGYGITLLPGRDINIQLPENQELTQKLNLLSRILNYPLGNILNAAMPIV